MYINRTEPRSGTESVSRKSIVNRRGKGDSSEGSFAETMASVIEVDVVQVGDHDEQKRQQPDQPPKRETEDGAQKSAEKTSLDIKV